MLLLAACQAAPAAAPEPTAAPARRTVTPPPTGAPVFATPSPASADIGRIKHVRPWLKQDGDRLIYTLMFLDGAGEPVFFSTRNAIVVQIGFYDSKDGVQFRFESRLMTEDSLKFEVGIDPVLYGDRLYVTWHAQLPDGRIMAGEGWEAIEGRQATPEPG